MKRSRVAGAADDVCARSNSRCGASLEIAGTILSPRPAAGRIQTVPSAVLALAFSFLGCRDFASAARLSRACRGASVLPGASPQSIRYETDKYDSFPASLARMRPRSFFSRLKLGDAEVAALCAMTSLRTLACDLDGASVPALESLTRLVNLASLQLGERHAEIATILRASALMASLRTMAFGLARPADATHLALLGSQLTSLNVEIMGIPRAALDWRVILHMRCLMDLNLNSAWLDISMEVAREFAVAMPHLARLECGLIRNLPPFAGLVRLIYEDRNDWPIRIAPPTQLTLESLSIYICTERLGLDLRSLVQCSRLDNLSVNGSAAACTEIQNHASTAPAASCFQSLRTLRTGLSHPSGRDVADLRWASAFTSLTALHVDSDPDVGILWPTLPLLTGLWLSLYRSKASNYEPPTHFPLLAHLHLSISGALSVLGGLLGGFLASLERAPALRSLQISAESPALSPQRMPDEYAALLARDVEIGFSWRPRRQLATHLPKRVALGARPTQAHPTSGTP